MLSKSKLRLCRTALPAPNVRLNSAATAFGTSICYRSVLGAWCARCGGPEVAGRTARRVKPDDRGPGQWGGSSDQRGGSTQERQDDAGGKAACTAPPAGQRSGACTGGCGAQRHSAPVFVRPRGPSLRRRSAGLAPAGHQGNRNAHFTSSLLWFCSAALCVVAMSTALAARRLLVFSTAALSATAKKAGQRSASGKQLCMCATHRCRRWGAAQRVLARDALAPPVSDVSSRLDARQGAYAHAACCAAAPVVGGAVAAPGASQSQQQHRRWTHLALCCCARRLGRRCARRLACC